MFSKNIFLQKELAVKQDKLCHVKKSASDLDQKIEQAQVRTQDFQHLF